MSQRRKTVRQLAKEAGLDVDETLVTLWEAGFTELLEPEDFIRGGSLTQARRSLGLATRRELKDPVFWQNLLGLEPRVFSAMLETRGIRLGQTARRLPPKAVTRLKAEARRVGIDPLTGFSVPSIRKPPSKSELPAKGESTKRAEHAAVVVPLVADTRDAQRTRRGKDEIDEWYCLGHTRDLHWLDYKEVEAIHFAIADDFADSPDPIAPAGVRSENILASAVFRAQTSIGDVLKYSTVEASAAALLSGIVHDHPFHNGNKRTALVAMLVFLDANGFIPTCQEDELFKLLLLLAQHRLADGPTQSLPDREVRAVTEWLCDRIRPVETGNHPIAFRKLRTVLGSFQCETSIGAGAKVNISREIVTRGRLGLRRRTRLKTQIHYHSEGREVGKSTIKKIREDLHLDELHGVDSRDFYAAGGSRVTDFIASYRKTLRRLAKL